MLKTESLVFIIVDIQEKLARMMHDRDELFKNARILTQGMLMLDVPIIWLEQIPEKLGSTINEIRKLLPDIRPIAKSSFSACGNDEFMETLKKVKKKQALIAGIETHICVYQTASDLVRLGYEVEVSADAVSSRTPLNRDVGLEKIKRSGAGLTTTETVLFELLKKAGGDKFRETVNLIK